MRPFSHPIAARVVGFFLLSVSLSQEAEVFGQIEADVPADMSAQWLESFKEIPLAERERALPHLLAEFDRAIKKRDEQRAWRIGNAIATVGERAVRPLLQRCELDEDESLPRTAWPAIDALRKLGPAAGDAFDPLLELLGASGVLFQEDYERLLSALRATAPSDAVLAGRLLPAMKTRSAVYVADLLADIGPAAKVAVPELLPLLAKRDIHAVGSAARALLCIAPEDADVNARVQAAFWQALPRVTTDDPFRPWGEYEFLATIVAKKPTLFEAEMLRRLREGDLAERRHILMTWAYVSGELSPAAVPLAVKVMESPAADTRTKVAAIRLLTECSTGEDEIEVDLSGLIAGGFDDWGIDYLDLLCRRAAVTADGKDVRKLLRARATCKLGLTIVRHTLTNEQATAELLDFLKRVDRWEGEWNKEPRGLGDEPDRSKWVDFGQVRSVALQALGERGVGEGAVAAVAEFYRQARRKPKPESLYGGGFSIWRPKYSAIAALGALGRRGEDVVEHLLFALDDPDVRIQVTAAGALLHGANADRHTARIEEVCRTLAREEKGYEVRILFLWFRVASDKSREDCLKACRQALQGSEPRLLVDHWGFHFDEKCSVLLDDLQQLMRDDEVRQTYRLRAAEAILKITPEDEQAQAYLIQAASDEIVAANETPVLAHYYCASCILPPHDVETQALRHLRVIKDAQADALLRDALRSRNIEMRRAAAQELSFRK